jgi:hypothetical protein
MDIPITLEGILSVAGLGVIVGLLLQWVKQWVSEPRWYNLIGLGVAVVLAEIARGLVGGWTPRGALEALLVGIGGAALATFGYEAISNLRGLTGTGPRADV